MKSRIILLSAFFFALTMFHPITAKADIVGDILGGILGCDNSNQGTNLPINSNVVYLMIAGIAIGIIAVKKANSAKIVASKA